MPKMADPEDIDIKLLKGAWRSAVGGPKRGGRKGKNKNKTKSKADLNGEGEGQAASVADPIPGPTCQSLQSLQSQEGSLVSLLDDMTVGDLTEYPEEEINGGEQVEPPATAGRITRQQSARAHAGQYLGFGLLCGQGYSFGSWDFTTLVSGRRSGSSRSARSNGRNSGRDIADSHLAEEAIAKPMRGLSKQAPVVVDTVEISTQEEKQVSNMDEGSVVHQSPVKSPAKTLLEVEEMYGPVERIGPADGGEDSFVEQITCRSPAKPVSRIEDSLEALDQLEEALEELGQATLAERILSPEKTRQKAKLQQAEFKIPLDINALMDKTKVEAEKVANDARKENVAKPKSGHASMRVKPTAPRASVIKKAASMTFRSTTSSLKPTEEQTKSKPTTKAPRPISVLPPKEPVKSTKPTTRPAAFELPGEAIARKLRELREARLAQRESSEDTFHTARAIPAVGPKVKSTKPPTIPAAFELPGEALSRRKKKAHEARLKAQEDEERKRREFEAKPPPKNVVQNVAPRDTAASRARQSRIGLENIENERLSVAKRGSTNSPHRPSIVQMKVANTSAPRSPVSAPAATRKPSPKTVSGLSIIGRELKPTHELKASVKSASGHTMRGRVMQPPHELQPSGKSASGLSMSGRIMQPTHELQASVKSASGISMSGRVMQPTHELQLSVKSVSGISMSGRITQPTHELQPSVKSVSGLSMSGRALQRSVSIHEVQAQRQRAKEIYNRDARLAEDMESQRREREAAARRAREEAAERGRQASREWAEKQMAKKIAGGDKGLRAGYGPGGQMGLKG
jgi:hypothetical protein